MLHWLSVIYCNTLICHYCHYVITLSPATSYFFTCHWFHWAFIDIAITAIATQPLRHYANSLDCIARRQLLPLMSYWYDTLHIHNTSWYYYNDKYFIIIHSHYHYVNNSYAYTHYYTLATLMINNIDWHSCIS